MTAELRRRLKTLVDRERRRRVPRELMIERELENAIRGVGERACEWCGAPFYARHPATRFCCSTHRDRAWRRTEACRRYNREYKQRKRARELAA